MHKCKQQGAVGARALCPGRPWGAHTGVFWHFIQHSISPLLRTQTLWTSWTTQPDVTEPCTMHGLPKPVTHITRRYLLHAVPAMELHGQTAAELRRGLKTSHSDPQYTFHYHMALTLGCQKLAIHSVSELGGYFTLSVSHHNWRSLLLLGRQTRSWHCHKQARHQPQPPAALVLLSVPVAPAWEYHSGACCLHELHCKEQFLKRKNDYSSKATS